MLDRTTRPLAAGPERCGGSNGYRTATDASDRHGDNATSPPTRPLVLYRLRLIFAHKPGFPINGIPKRPLRT
jgi:hypothetical protein